MFGYLQDRFGFRGHYLAGGGLCFLLCHLLLVFGDSIGAAVAAHAALGLALVWVLAVWPCIPRLVAPERVGVAMGLATCVFNAALCATPLLVAAIGDPHAAPPYAREEAFFLAAAAASVVAALALLYLDRRRHANALALPELESPASKDLELI